MSQIITFSDGQPLGTFSQIKLDNGDNILISLTQKEIAIFKMVFFGKIPIKKIFIYDVADFYSSLIEKNELAKSRDTILGAIVEYILPCINIDEVKQKMERIINYK